MTERPADPLLSELRSVIESADPIPDAVVAAAKAAFGWATVDAELAELVADSARATDRGLVTAGTRDAAAARLITFEAAGRTVEIEVAETGNTRHVVGQLVPMERASITVRWPDGSRVTESDEVGRFSLDGLPAGPISLTVRRADTDVPVATSWVVI
jgi:hypothetical protein